MATGSKRRRGEAWELRVYAGVHPLSGNRQYVTKTVRGSERDADRALRRLVDEVDEGSRVAATGRRTFRDASEKWLAAARPNMSPGTVMTTEDYLARYLIPYIGERPIERIGAEDLDAVYATLRSRTGRSGRPLSAATVVRVHGIARVVFEQARRWRWIARNPALDATPPSIPKRRPTTPGAQDIAQFVTWVAERDPDFAMYLRMAAIVGARRGELCALRWSDIDLEAGRLAISRRLVAGRDPSGRETVFELEGTKANAGHAVALDPVTVERLKAHRQTCAERALACGISLPRDAHVFSIEPDGADGWKPHSVTQRFRRLRVRAGLAPIRLHDVRHYVATHLIDKGVAITTVSERIGHSSSRTTLGVYGQGVSETDHRAAAILAEALDGVPTLTSPGGGGRSD